MHLFDDLQTPRLWEVLHSGAGGYPESSTSETIPSRLLAPGECVAAV